MLDREAHICAVQVKFRARREDIALSELATFFALSEQADYRLVISNGYGVEKTAAERSRVGFIGTEAFDALTAEDFRNIDSSTTRTLGSRRLAQPLRTNCDLLR